MVKSTSWEDLQPVLEETMACHGVPKVLFMDGGPPYNSHDFGKFARRMGFKHRTVTLEVSSGRKGS